MNGHWSRPVFNLNLAAWRRLRGKYAEPIPPLIDLRFHVAGLMFSSLAKLQNLPLREKLNQIEVKRPIFILGHWRSGTTLLHELLALDDRLLSPTTFQCFNPQRFLISSDLAPAQADRQVGRPTGDVIVTASSPQEEEFALLCLGVVSSYEAFLFPKALYDLDKLCDPDEFEEGDVKAWEAALRGFLKAVLQAGGINRRLLLKSPSNSFRVGKLRKLFPEAVFVNLVRSPPAVFASTVRMWEIMWERYAIGKPLGRSSLEGEVSRIQASLDRKLEQSASDLAASQFETITYENLVSDPTGTIATMYQALDLGDPSPLFPKYREYLATAKARRDSAVEHLSNSAIDSGRRYGKPR